MRGSSIREQSAQPYRKRKKCSVNKPAVSSVAEEIQTLVTIFLDRIHAAYADLKLDV